MLQRLNQRFIGVFQFGIFANNRNINLTFGFAHRRQHLIPARQIRRRRVRYAKRIQDLAIQPLAVIGMRHLINRIDIARLYNRAFTHITKQPNLALFTIGNGPVAPAHQNIGLDADRTQFLDRVLGRFGFHLTGGGNEGKQGQMHENGLTARQIILQLTNGLEKGQSFNIAYRAANLAQHEIQIFHIALDEGFDGIRHMRNDLHRTAQIIAAAFAFQNVAVNLSGRHIVAATGGHTGEALIMTQIKVCLGPIIGHIHLAVLIRAHRAGVYIEIRVKFP